MNILKKETKMCHLHFCQSKFGKLKKFVRMYQKYMYLSAFNKHLQLDSQQTAH